MLAGRMMLTITVNYNLVAGYGAGQTTNVPSINMNCDLQSHCVRTALVNQLEIAMPSCVLNYFPSGDHPRLTSNGGKYYSRFKKRTTHLLSDLYPSSNYLAI